MSVPNPATVDWVPIFAGGNPLAYRADWAAGTTYVDGDIVVKDGVAYLCAGGPTSVAPDIAPWGGAIANRPPGELAYAETIVDTSLSATVEASAQIIATAPAVVLDGVTPILVEWSGSLVSTPVGAGAITNIWLFDNGVSLGRIGTSSDPAAGSPMYAPFRCARRLTPAAGSHVYTVRGTVSTGSATVTGGVGGPGAAVPNFIRVSQANPYMIAPAGPTVPTYGIALPSSPADGQEHVLVDSLTNPSYQWRFRYNAGSSSAYKWEFIGGSSWSVYVATSETVTGDNTWRDPATVGPSITVPRAGDYEVIGSVGNVYNSGVASMSCGVSIGATAADWTAGFYEATAGQVVSPMFQGVYLGLAASSALRLRYLASAGVFTVRGRRLSVLPVRVA